ncbi:MAG: class I SAM-dependent methyltransferase [Ignavibacteria bacterium]|nr:class I SAM-dependent methyltransferase [Ignavibacteria bacterium]MBP6510127.1 class I SAM-dependent methyltransferase [Candidatus Kapabacteria bacterium]MBK6419896.1 class I SAM-dependent methyltransferase [Ignavibacteria bacterium]MBK7184362.1 class I SAM-dependent methyltransferase [Ignavibacteria bacterium]MBK7413166.1 class I SAM-dependent methyltransferase [Ignavibacteria bacterium]
MSPLPKDLVDQVAQMDLHPRTIRNVRMQYRLAEHTLIPWLRGLGQLPTNAAVCEIGCAEGGVLAAFAQLGASYTLGTDIQGALLTQISDPLWRGLGLNMEFTQHDVIYEEIPPEWRARFDIVLLRDVIEHLDDPAIALKNIARLLKPGGVVLVTFPPYTSAFGGHQQLMGTKAGAIPFLHMLPWSVFGGFVKGGDPVNQEELERLHTIRCSARKVLSSAHAAGLRVRSERYFGLRPVFRWKYQRPIPSFEITALRSIPGVRALAMEAAFVFQLPA